MSKDTSINNLLLVMLVTHIYLNKFGFKPFIALFIGASLDILF